MKILVIGSGAREHAIIRCLQGSLQKPFLYCYGSAINPGIKQLTSGYAIGNVADCRDVTAKALGWGITLAIIGPEAPLEKGMSDSLWAAGIPVIGPRRALAQIETSKKFARDLMRKYQINGLPRYRNFSALDNEVDNFLNELGENYVIKADGLMSGKGVKVAGEHLHSHREARAFCQEIINNNQQFVIEEKLIGQEFSFMCFADGKTLLPMPLVQDHKRAYNGDTGPNTGGMGSYSDANHSLPFLTRNDVKEAFAINEAVLQALGREFDDKYIGILYGSFIATHKGIYVIEFNARFGDPEVLNVLSILESDFVSICQAMVNGNLNDCDVEFSHKATVCKYKVPKGYPENPLKDFAVDFGAISDEKNLYLGSVNEVDTQVIATGSRTAAYVGIAETITRAERKAEEQISLIDGPLYHRQDIGTAALIQNRMDCMQRIRAQ